MYNTQSLLAIYYKSLQDCFVGKTLNIIKKYNIYDGKNSFRLYFNFYLIENME